MLNEEGKDIRIIDLPDADQVEPGFYVPVDTYAGTKKYDLYDVTNEVDKAVDYVSTVSAQIEGKADKSELDGLEDQIAGKADAAVVYTKDEVDGLLEAKVDADEVYGKDEIDSMIEGKADYSDLEVLSAALEGKADSADVYTIDEINDLLDSKANIDSLDQVSAYVDSSLDNIQDEFDSVNDILDTVADDISTVSGAFDSLYDEVETAQSDISDLQTAIEDKVDTSDVYLKTETYSKEEVDTSLSGKQNKLTSTQLNNIDKIPNISNNLLDLQAFFNSIKKRIVLTPTPKLIIGGREYETVMMPDGNVWMAENLDFKFDGCIIGEMSTEGEDPRAAYYDNDEATYGVNGNKYGLLYNWYAAKYINDNRATLCPGWHVPNQNELFGLVSSNVVGYEPARKLKSKTGWAPSAAGNDVYGFDVKGVGFWQSSKSVFKDIDNIAFLWTSTPSGNKANIAWFTTENNYVFTSTNNKYDGLSIRLIKDA